MRSRTAQCRLLVSTAAVMGALAALTGCSALPDLGPGTAGQAGTTALTLGRAPDVAILAVGDCVNARDLLTELESVPCSTDHDWEIYAVPAAPGAGAGGFPGEEALVAAAEQSCGTQFEALRGRTDGPGTGGSPELGFTYLVPAETEWADENVLVCLIGDMGGPRRGSLTEAGDRG